VQCRVAHKNDSKINYDFTMINLFNVRREFLSKEKAKKDVRCPYCYFVNLPINYITDKKIVFNREVTYIMFVVCYDIVKGHSSFVFRV